VDVEKLGGKEGELWGLTLVGQSSLYLQFLRCLISRDKSGVARFCSVMVPSRVVRACLGQGRKILILQSRTLHNKLHFKLLFINCLKTLDTIFTENYTLCTLMKIALYAADDTRITIYRSEVIFTSELFESWMKTPVDD
jgi:hypothetical protein